MCSLIMCTAAYFMCYARMYYFIATEKTLILTRRNVTRCTLIMKANVHKYMQNVFQNWTRNADSLVSPLFKTLNEINSQFMQVYIVSLKLNGESFPSYLIPRPLLPFLYLFVPLPPSSILPSHLSLLALFHPSLLPITRNVFKWSSPFIHKQKP